MCVGIIEVSLVSSDMTLEVKSYAQKNANLSLIEFFSLLVLRLLLLAVRWLWCKCVNMREIHHQPIIYYHIAFQTSVVERASRAATSTIFFRPNIGIASAVCILLRSRLQVSHVAVEYDRSTRCNFAYLSPERSSRRSRRRLMASPVSIKDALGRRARPSMIRFRRDRLALLSTWLCCVAARVRCFAREGGIRGKSTL